jgi:hypothetical protein
MPYPHNYANEEDYRQNMVGKTIEDVSYRGLGRMVLHYTDGSYTNIDACVEHQVVKQEVNLILNSGKSNEV